MIEVKNLTKKFTLDGHDFKAIDDVNFEVKKGEIFGIIGLSGAGKSTLVRCINRLEEPTNGEILIEGKNILNLSEPELLEERRQIGMIFQNFNLFMQKTVYQNIAYPLEISKFPKEKVDERVNELLKFIDLEEKKNAYPSELSGGQKQRVAIARSIATNPKILLSDEGTSALDPANTKVILDLLKKVVNTYQMTIIMITHQMEVAKDICDRIAVMDHGKIVEQNDTNSLFKNPKTQLTRSFIQHLEIEEEIVASEFKGKLLRLAYDGENVAEPILSKCLKKYNVYFNIISANVNKVTNGAMGYLTIEITGEDNEVEKAIEFLISSKVNVEVL